MECSVYSTVKQVGFSEKRAKNIAFFVFKTLKKKNPAVSIHFIGEKRIQRLNSDYRGKNSVTDVLSFALHADDDSLYIPKGEPIDWGDVFICVPKIKKQAKEHGVSYQEEMTRMMVHGLLHLFAYDHIVEKDAKKMIPLQEKIVKNVMKK